jgi:hypothetical protein
VDDGLGVGCACCVIMSCLAARSATVSLASESSLAGFMGGCTTGGFAGGSAIGGLTGTVAAQDDSSAKHAMASIVDGPGMVGRSVKRCCRASRLRPLPIPTSVGLFTMSFSNDGKLDAVLQRHFR